jgi:hypothetical protein
MGAGAPAMGFSHPDRQEWERRLRALRSELANMDRCSFDEEPVAGPLPRSHRETLHTRIDDLQWLIDNCGEDSDAASAESDQSRAIA